MDASAHKPHLTHRLVAGVDYPATYRAFVEVFPGEEACLRYVEALRWHDGFVCPACGSAGEPWRASQGSPVQLGNAHLRVRSELMMGTRQIRVTTVDDQVVFEDSLPMAVGEYFVRAVEANQRSFIAPINETAAEMALGELRELAYRLDEKLREQLANVGPAHQTALRAQAEKELNFAITDLLAEIPPVYFREY